MTARLLILCLSLLYLSGCGSDAPTTNQPTYSKIPVDTELEINGVTEGSVMSRNCLYATIDRSKSVFRQYTSIEYTLDTQLAWKPAYFGGKNTIQLAIPINSSGPHQFAVRGILKSPNLEAGKKINFQVDYQLSKAAIGKYAGDRTVYDKLAFGNFSNMRVEFVSYSASKAGSNLVGAGMKFTDLSGNNSYYTGASSLAAAINNNQPYVTVDYLMNSAVDQVRATGIAFNHFMELLLLQGPTAGTADKIGDLRLYRNDPAAKTVIAYCSSLKGYNDNPPRELQAIVTMNSFDSINFFGHLRLWDKKGYKGGHKVWTYQIAAYAQAKGLSASQPSLTIWPSISTSPLDDFLLGAAPYPDVYKLTNPSGAPTPTVPSIMTFVIGPDGKLKINQFSLKLDDFYDAAAGSIQMKMSYKP